MIPKKERIKIVCNECKKVFYELKCKNLKFCKRECFKKHWLKLNIQSLRTPETFEKIQKGKVGRKRPELSGPKSRFWKGGNSKNYKTGYYSSDYINWRKAVFKRDDFTCQGCGDKGYITAHHIKSFAHYPELRFDLKNGQTLCEPCHKLTDNYKGRNTKERIK